MGYRYRVEQFNSVIRRYNAFQHTKRSSEAEKMKFYDVKARKSFNSNKYKIVRKGKTTFAVTKSPYTKIKCYRIIKRGRRRGKG